MVSNTTTTKNSEELNEYIPEIASSTVIDLDDAGITDADERFTVRKRQFQRIFRTLNDTAPRFLDDFKPSPSVARDDTNEDHLVTFLEAGALPWSRSNTTPREYSEKLGVHSEYGLQLFFSTCFDAVIEGDLGRSEVEKSLANTRERLDNFTGDGLPSDGSKGQAKAAMRGTIRAYEWLLGEYDGEQNA